MKQQFKRVFNDYAVGIFMVVLFAVCVVFVPKFSSTANLLNISTQISINGLIATGMTFVILTGGIDLSVGSVAAVAAVFSADIVLKMKDATSGACILVFFGVSLALGLICGLFSGFFINELRVPPFIATMATNNICRGIAFLYTDAKPVAGMAKTFKILGMTKIWGWLPVCVVVLVVALVLAYIYLTKTPQGRYVFAVGSGEEVSKLSGINVKLTKYICYVVCAFLAALAGSVYASKLQAGQPSACTGYELNAIAAVAMGGNSMSGGSGGIVQTIFGILIIGFLNNAMNLLGINAYWQNVALGFIILIAVVSDTAKSSRKQ